MGILTNLLQGKKIKFESDDSDSWGYENDQLVQYVNEAQTGNTLAVVAVDEDNITINWGDAESTLPENYLIFID